MLPKNKRIPRRIFPKHFSGGARHGEYFSLRYGPAEDEPSSKFAVVVSKKIASRAVDRNKLRRRAYEVIREYEKNRALPPGRYALYAKKGSAELSFKNLHEELFLLFDSFRV